MAINNHNLVSEASFSVSWTMTPIPSWILWMGALHMKAQVVTSLFLPSTWALSTSVLTCLQPSSFTAPAVPAYGHLHTDTERRRVRPADLFTTTCWWRNRYVRVALLVLAHGDLAAGQELGSQDWGDAAHAQRFSSFVESLDELLQLRLDRAVLVLHRPVAQVLCHAKASWKSKEICLAVAMKQMEQGSSLQRSGWAAMPTWDDGRIELRDVQRGQVGHVPPGDAGALLQDVSLLLCGFPLAVVHNMHLIHIGSKHLHLKPKRSRSNLSAPCSSTVALQQLHLNRIYNRKQSRKFSSLVLSPQHDSDGREQPRLRGPLCHRRLHSRREWLQHALPWFL